MGVLLAITEIEVAALWCFLFSVSTLFQGFYVELGVGGSVQGKFDESRHRGRVFINCGTILGNFLAELKIECVDRC